jgi:hypothetical protein
MFEIDVGGAVFIFRGTVNRLKYSHAKLVDSRKGSRGRQINEVGALYAASRPHGWSLGDKAPP